MFKGRKKLKSHSITKHWLRNSFGVIAVILLVLEILLIALVRSYYYDSSRQYMTSRMKIVTSQVVAEQNDGKQNRSQAVRNIVEGYEDKEKIELMAVTSSGKVDVTSSGFLPAKNDDMTDYKLAKSAQNGFAYNIYKLPTGEKVMAATQIIPSKGSEYEAVRMISSMKNIDGQILGFALIVTVIVAVVLVMVLFSGMFFVKSIIRPLQGLADATKNFAKGDFSQRIERTGDDELGELCDSINYMAEELSNTEAMKNEFISSVSHELRTPLTAIKGWTETVEAMYGDVETFKKGMRVINSETERLSQMVEELLDFSRIQDGRLTLIMDTMDVLAELGETMLIYQERARVLGITLNYYEPKDLPFVYGDRHRLKQVFINVVDNAIKYSDKGDTVSVEAYEENNEICILVSDTGIGIAKEDLPKIKTKFFKANHTRRGSGIGLAVADEIIMRHGGTLTLDSEEGVGTTVMITLPCMESSKKSDKEDTDTVDVELISSEPVQDDLLTNERNDNNEPNKQ